MQLRLDIIVQVSQELHHPANRRVSSQVPTQGQKDRTTMTQPGNGNAARQPSGPTARSVDKKVNDLTARYDSDIASLTERLGTQGKTIKLVNRRVDRLQDVVSLIGNRLGEDHDTIVTILTPKLADLEMRVNQLGIPLNLAAVIAGFTDEEVKEILAIQAEDELTTSAIVSGMIDRVGSIQVQLNQVVDTLAETRGMVNAHEQRLDNTDARLDAIDGPDGQLATLRDAFYADLGQMSTTVNRNMTETLDSAEIVPRTNKGAIIAAVVTFLVIWLGMLLFGLFFGGDLVGPSIQAGKTVGTTHIAIPFGWIGFGAGLFAAGMVLLNGRRFDLSFTRTRTTHQTSSSTTSNGTNNAAARTEPLQPVAIDAHPQSCAPRDERPRVNS